jgi:hypothetical protein
MVLTVCLVARIISYTGSVVYLVWAGPQVDWTVVGIWFLATYLSRPFATALADRIWGPPTIGEITTRNEDLIAAVIALATLIGLATGLW